MLGFFLAGRPFSLCCLECRVFTWKWRNVLSQCVIFVRVDSSLCHWAQSFVCMCHVYLVILNTFVGGEKKKKEVMSQNHSNLWTQMCTELMGPLPSQQHIVRTQCAQRHHTEADLPSACSHAQNTTKCHLFTSVSVFTWGGISNACKLPAFLLSENRVLVYRQGINWGSWFGILWLRICLGYGFVLSCTKEWKIDGVTCLCVRVCRVSRERYPALQ